MPKKTLVVIPRGDTGGNVIGNALRINDFFMYGNLLGWSTKGKLAYLYLFQASIGIETRFNRSKRNYEGSNAQSHHGWEFLHNLVILSKMIRRRRLDSHIS